MSTREQQNRTSVVPAEGVNGSVPATIAAPTNAAEVAAAWLLGYGDATREAYGRDLRAWGEFLSEWGTDPLDARRAHVEAWSQAMTQAGLAPSTIGRRLTALSGFYKYATGEGLLERSPLANVRRPRASEDSPHLGLSEAQIRAMLDAARAWSPRDYALTCLLALNGLRISEALGADVADLGEERGHRVLTVTRKGGKTQRIALAAVTYDALNVYLAGREEGPLFITSSGKRLDRVAGWKVVRRLARTAGITGNVSPHTLRHGFVTTALDTGIDLRDVQDAAGHADPRTTRRYDRGRHNLQRHPTYRLASVFVHAENIDKTDRR